VFSAEINRAIALKCRQPSTGLHGATSQKMIFILAAVRTEISHQSVFTFLYKDEGRSMIRNATLLIFNTLKKQMMDKVQNKESSNTSLWFYIAFNALSRLSGRCWRQSSRSISMTRYFLFQLGVSRIQNLQTNARGSYVLLYGLHLSSLVGHVTSWKCTINFMIRSL
jgi:hypothetical protein